MKAFGRGGDLSAAAPFAPLRVLTFMGAVRVKCQQLDLNPTLARGMLSYLFLNLGPCRCVVMGWWDAGGARQVERMAAELANQAIANPDDDTLLGRLNMQVNTHSLPAPLPPPRKMQPGGAWLACVLG